jgi:hypothetical protein
MRIFNEKTGEMGSFRPLHGPFAGRLNVILTLIFSSLLFSAGWAQTAEERAAEAYEVLKRSGVVVRLPTQTAKMSAMTTLLEEGDLSPGNRDRLEGRLADLRRESRQSNLLRVRLFRESFTAGPLFFVPDTAMHRLLAGERQGLLLTDELEVDPEGVLPARFLILRFDYTDASEQARAEALIFSDDQLADLTAPFPAATLFNNAWYAVNQILAPARAEEIRLRKTIERMQQRLNRFSGE